MNVASSNFFRAPLWDRVGIIASALCVLHCIVTPMLVVALPLLAVTEHATHSSLALLIVGVALLALLPGYFRHRRMHVLLLPLIGICLLWAGVLAPEEGWGGIPEWVPTVMGGLVMVSVHFRNAYLCRLCTRCRSEGCHSLIHSSS